MTSEKITVVEISECFPNKFKPVTGEFILQHARTLSAHCKVVMIVPLRYIPPKELFSLNPFKFISRITKWFSFLTKTKNFTEGNLIVIYFGYISLPRLFFEFVDKHVINLFLYNRIVKKLKGFHPDIIYCNWLRQWTEFSRKLADHFNIPLIIDHHEDILSLKRLFPDGYGKILKSFEKADRIIVHSKASETELLNEKLSIPELACIYLGQNFKLEQTEKQFNPDVIKLLCVSHLSERRKNIEVLITAISLIKPVSKIELTIAGDGSLKKEYIKLAEKLKLDKTVHFTGSKSQLELGKIMEESDLFVLPSYPEAFGIVFIEALAKGLPVITCEGNGGGEELKSLGYDVVLVKPYSHTELAGAIENLMKDKKRMSEMSLNGKEIVKKYFTWKRNALNTFDIINETLRVHNQDNNKVTKL